jgi:hypothetical protein
MKANDPSEHFTIIRSLPIFLWIVPQNEMVSAVNSVMKFQVNGWAEIVAGK